MPQNCKKIQLTPIYHAEIKVLRKGADKDSKSGFTINRGVGNIQHTRYIFAKFGTFAMFAIFAICTTFAISAMSSEGRLHTIS